MKKEDINIRIAIVTNIPSPYRVVFFNALNKLMGDKLLVLYCSGSEPNRQWKIGNLEHNHIFLRRSVFNRINPFVYLNVDVIRKLRSHSPDVIVTGGFYPTMLLSILYSRLNKKKHFINTDGWYLTEKELTIFHRLLRKIVYKSTTGFFPVSVKGQDTFISHGINPNKIHIIPYVIENQKFNLSEPVQKEYDVLFSGQLIERKMPVFYFNVCKALAEEKPDLKALIIGSGPLENEVTELFQKSKINYKYKGFVQQDQIPKIFASCKLFLFPTMSDGWGVVANETCASGVPTIIAENAGAAGDLIIHNYNGYILPLDEKTWCSHALRLLNDDKLYTEFSNNCKLQIEKYSPDIIAGRFLSACIA